MIKETEIIVNGHRSNYNFYKKLGYDINYRKPCLIKVKDLMSGSMVKITSICDNCGNETKKEFKEYYNYTKGFTESYYCNKCKSIKGKKTCIEKYGVDNPMKTQGVKDTLKNSLLEKYGVDHYSKTDEYKEKYRNTCLEKYGVKNSFMNKTIIKDIKICREKSTEDKYSYYLNDDYKILSYNSDKFAILHKKCNNVFDINRQLFYTRNLYNTYLCTNCKPIDDLSSTQEIELQRFLMDNNINFLTGDRKILNGLELDIYIPEYNLAIEMNGVYWHNELYKDDKYHLNKTIECNKLGIQLIHVWEDDWKYKKEIIKSIILNRLGLIKNKIYARKCKIKKVNSIDAKLFLDDNHIQGFSPSQIKLGLYYNNELVSLMTFGWRYINTKREFELIRFCNKINYSVIGAASKLFKHFIKTNNDEIISYADISLFNGVLYEKLGFKKVSLSQPNYFWVIDGIRKHRFNYNKKKLVKEGFDSNKTEVEIMHERGYFRVWGCGQEKWIYKI